MRRRITTLVLAMVFAATAVAVAQGKHARATKDKTCDRGMRAGQQLGLTPEQTEKITGIVKQYRSDVGQVLKSEAPREQKADQIKALKDAATGAINAVLTPEQQEKGKALIDKLLSPRHHGAKKGLWVLKQLDLTDDQKAQVKTIMQDSRTQAKAIMDDSTLTKEQKRERLGELKKATFEKVKALLTPEQLQKLEGMKNKRPLPRERGAR